MNPQRCFATSVAYFPPNDSMLHTKNPYPTAPNSTFQETHSHWAVQHLDTHILDFVAAILNEINDPISIS